MKLIRSAALALVLAAASACEVNTTGGSEAESNQAANTNTQQNQTQTAEQARVQQMRDDARQPFQNLRFVVDQSDREVRVFNGDQLLRTHDVAVGTEDNPTPNGEYRFHRVDLNPEWVPPDSEWAEDEEVAAPGAPDNPMGRARLVFQMPYTIHGTDELQSLGKATSHGSIRVANENVIQLAEMLLKAGGAWEGDDWFRNMAESRNEEFQVPLQQEIPITVQE